MKKPVRKDVAQALDEVNKRRNQAIRKLQLWLRDELSLVRVELEHLAENLSGQKASSELAEELVLVVKVAETLLVRTVKKQRRAKKVSLNEKVDWLKARLAGGKSEIKGKLVEEFAKSNGMKISPALLDKAIQQSDFETKADSRDRRNVFVSLCKR